MKKLVNHLRWLYSRLCSKRTQLENNRQISTQDSSFLTILRSLLHR
jgi:hypothetical protein